MNVLPVLLEHGADVNLGDTSGRTALHSACFQTRADVAKILLEADADPTLTNKNGQSPLDFLELSLDDAVMSSPTFGEHIVASTQEKAKEVLGVPLQRDATATFRRVWE